MNVRGLGGSTLCVFVLFTWVFFLHGCSGPVLIWIMSDYVAIGHDGGAGGFTDDACVLRWQTCALGPEKVNWQISTPSACQ